MNIDLTNSEKWSIKQCDVAKFLSIYWYNTEVSAFNF